MLKLFTILTLLCASICSKAQMSFVPADSVMLWTQDITNFRNTALSVSPTLKEHISTMVLANNRSALETAWNKRQALSSESPNLGFEAANQLYTAAQLLRHTHDAEYARAIQNLAYFPLLQSIESSTSAPERYAAAQALMNAVSMLYATEGSNLYINFYANSSAFIHTDSLSFQLDAITAMPYDERVKFRFSRIRPQKGARFKVHLQLPEGNWDAKNLPIYCNGHEVSYKVERGYAVIENVWQSGYEIFFDLPAPLYSEAEATNL
ncbi:MAG: glycoside hydrolase family 127 protein [Bacteroidaceae bacterium]|nr:glycoside hydrolase family 127 protein [Bacteroidaceae bacterium]